MKKWTIPVAALAAVICVTVTLLLPATAEHELDALDRWLACTAECDDEYEAWMAVIDDHVYDAASFSNFVAGTYYDLPIGYDLCLDDAEDGYNYAMRNIRDRGETGLGSLVGLGGHMSVIASDAGSTYIAEVSVCNTAYLASLQ